MAIKFFRILVVAIILSPTLEYDLEDKNDYCQENYDESQGVTFSAIRFLFFS